MAFIALYAYRARSWKKHSNNINTMKTTLKTNRISIFYSHLWPCSMPPKLCEWNHCENIVQNFYIVCLTKTKTKTKIPSEMEVAPRYNCWHCWHCWHCWLCWHCWQCGCQGVFSNWMSHAEFQENFLIDCRTQVSSQRVFSNWLSHMVSRSIF